MKRKALRIISAVLCFIFISSLALSASALTISKTNKTTECTILTHGDKLLGKTTTITVKNTGSNPIVVKFDKISGCKVYRSNGAGFQRLDSTTIYVGNSATYKIKTNFCNNGEVRVKVYSAVGGSYSYSITGKEYNMIARTG